MLLCLLHTCARTVGWAPPLIKCSVAAGVAARAHGGVVCAEGEPVRPATPGRLRFNPYPPAVIEDGGVHAGGWVSTPHPSAPNRLGSPVPVRLRIIDLGGRLGSTVRADAMHGHGRDPKAETRRYYMAANQTGVVVGKLGPVPRVSSCFQHSTELFT